MIHETCRELSGHRQTLFYVVHIIKLRNVIAAIECKFEPVNLNPLVLKLLNPAAVAMVYAGVWLLLVAMIQGRFYGHERLIWAHTKQLVNVRGISRLQSVGVYETLLLTRIQMLNRQSAAGTWLFLVAMIHELKATSVLFPEVID